MSALISSCSCTLWISLRYQGSPWGAPLWALWRSRNSNLSLQRPCRTKFLKAAARAGRQRLLALLSDRGTPGEHLRGLKLRTRPSVPLEQTEVVGECLLPATGRSCSFCRRISLPAVQFSKDRCTSGSEVSLLGLSQTLPLQVPLQTLLAEQPGPVVLL